MSSLQNPPFRILISGFGISGPAFALSLINHLPRSFPLSILITERFPHLRATGQQIDIRGQGLEAMRGISPTLEAAIRKRLVDEPGLEFIDFRTGKPVAYFGSNKTGKGAQTFSAEFEIMRGSLVDALKEELEAVNKKRSQPRDGGRNGAGIVEWRFGSWIESIDQSQAEAGSESEGLGPVRVKFNDGDEKEFDLVVGADGVGSKTRRLIFPDSVGQEVVELKKVGTTMGLFSIPPDRQNDGPAARWCALPGRRMIMTRRDSKDYLRVCLMFFGNDEELHRALKHGTVREQKEAWARKFAPGDEKSWWLAERFVDGLLNSEESNDFWTQELVQVKANTWSQGKVVLLGDAAHCPTPMTGAGATSAFVGAYVLAGEIAKICLDSNGRDEAARKIPEALNRYETTTRPFAEYIQATAPSEGLLHFFAPESSWGVRILNGIAWLLSALRIDQLAAYFETSDNFGKWELPRYGVFHD